MIVKAGNLLCAGTKSLNLTNIYACLLEMEPGQENWRLLPRQNTSALSPSSIRTTATSSATTTTSEAFQPILGIRGNSSTTTLQGPMTKPSVMVQIAIRTPSIQKLLSADDQCTESIVDEDTDISDMTSSSQHTLGSGNREPSVRGVVNFGIFSRGKAYFASLLAFYSSFHTPSLFPRASSCSLSALLVLPHTPLVLLSNRYYTHCEQEVVNNRFGFGKKA